MSNRNKYIILGLTVVVIGALFYFIMNSSSSAKPEDKKENLGEDTTIVKKPINPSGTYLLYNLLKKYSNTRSIQTIQTTETIELSELLPIESSNEDPNLYISISDNFFLYSADRSHLFEFVEKGNYAMISSNQMSTSVAKTLFGTKHYQTEGFYDTTVSITFNHPKFRTDRPLTILSETVNYHGRPKYQYWNLIDSFEVANNFIIISRSNSYVNCVMVPYGEGFFIVNFQPGAYSNINLATEDGKTNAENIFSHFPSNNIYWHQNFGKYSEYRGISKPKKSKIPPTQGSRSSPLQFILNNPALLMALILIVAGVLFYVIVFSKRQQKIIPPIESNENTSLEFIDVISKLYLQQKQHNKLINHMIQIFIAFNRNRYYINLTQKGNNGVERISEKSGIPQKDIQNILDTFKKAKTKKFSEQELIDLHIKLEHFYKNCN